MKGEAITKEQIRRIYALGAGAGLLESGNHDDLLHVFVHGITGKSSVKELTAAEFEAVERGLLEKMQMRNCEKPLEQRKPKAKTANKYEEHPGGMTQGQQDMVWWLMYSLRDKDGNAYSKASVGGRLCGIIRKVLHRDCTPQYPFRFLNYKDGYRLIEVLKYMCSNVKPKGGAQDAQ